MDEASIIQFITTSFEDVQLVAADGNHFFFEAGDEERKFPFITLVTNDLYDQFSNLKRPSVYRLNIAISKETFRLLFSDPNVTCDFTALDQIMPHPVYGSMYWVCVLNPSLATFETVKDLLVESYEIAIAKQAKHDSR